jgi:chemotaxis family two-component system response regulator Rcp1
MVWARKDNPFRILVVDDNLKALSRPYELDWAKDGSAALGLLAQLKSRTHDPMPHLILMDVNMPRLNGLEALQVIKSDPELQVIPVVMFSTSAAPLEVRRIYEAHANCFVEKPGSFEEYERLLRSIESFWMDYAVLPQLDDVRSRTGEKGPSHARATGEVSSQAIVVGESSLTLPLPQSPGCEEHLRLMEEFAKSVKELLSLHQQQFEAAVRGDPESNRFDLLIHMANEKKQGAKYDYLRHVESHGCSNLDAITHSS